MLEVIWNILLIDCEVPTKMSSPGRGWSFVEVVDWFETEGSVFTTHEDGEEARIRVVVSSQMDDEVIESIWDYLRTLGFHPSFRASRIIRKNGKSRKRVAECELLINLEQKCFLEHALPYLRTKKRRMEVIRALNWLRERRNLPNREFRQFSCPKVLESRGDAFRPSGSTGIE